MPSEPQFADPEDDELLVFAPNTIPNVKVDLKIQTATYWAMLDALTDEGYLLVKPVEGMALVGGKWRRFPSTHKLIVYPFGNWAIEHPLVCRVTCDDDGKRGLVHCRVHINVMEFYERLEPVPGEYEITSLDSIPGEAGRQLDVQ